MVFILDIYSGLKKSIRSLNPIASIAALGKNAKIICNNKTASAYGIDSPFDILTNLNAKMLFLGVDLKIYDLRTLC